jgi:steroid delta-isomerase-like uncharacterized protein
MPEARLLMQQYMDAIMRRDFDAVRALFHPGFSYTGADGQPQAGVEAAIALARTYLTAFPDLNFEIVKTHDTAAVAITEFVGRGTHRGDLLGIAATGQRVALSICNIIEVRDGKIYAEREYFDFAHVLQQLGVSTLPTTA